MVEKLSAQLRSSFESWRLYRNKKLQAAGKKNSIVLSFLTKSNLFTLFSFYFFSFSQIWPHIIIISNTATCPTHSIHATSFNILQTQVPNADGKTHVLMMWFMGHRSTVLPIKANVKWQRASVIKLSRIKIVLPIHKSKPNKIETEKFSNRH